MWEVTEIDGKDYFVLNDVTVPTLFSPSEGFAAIGTMSGDGIASAITPEDNIPDPLCCPHCTRDWHPGALTLQVGQMLNDHQFDPNYDPDTDDSPVVCIGAEFQGPMRSNVTCGAWTTTVVSGQPSPLETAQKKLTQIIESLTLLNPQ